MKSNTSPTKAKKLKDKVTSPLPMREGVSASRVWLPKIGDYKNSTEKYGKWETMLAFLIERFPFIRKQILVDRMSRGEIVTQTGEKISPETPFVPEIFLFYYREVPDEVTLPFKEKILFKDDSIIVVDKPHFMSVTPSGRYVKETLLSRLKHHYQLEDISPIHRLDRATAGVIMFSCNLDVRGAYQHLFQQREVKKTYEAIAPMVNRKFPLTYMSRIKAHEEIFFAMQEVEGETNSETYIEIIETKAGMAKYYLAPVTGRQHQLRVHMTALGCPILNDTFYPDVLPYQGEDYSKPLQLLSKTLEFSDPFTKKIRFFQSEQSLTL